MVDELRTFLAVVKYKNFTKAGEAVNLSQPAVSAQIGRLEKYFGTKLILRNSKGMQITEGGWVLYRRARELMDILERTSLEIQESSRKVSGVLKIGATYTVGECVMPGILAQFQELYPGVHMEMTIANTEDIREMVRQGEVRIGFIEGIHQRNDFVGCYFMEDSLVLLTCADHPLAVESKIQPRMLENQKWVSREYGSGTREYMDLFLTKYHLEPVSVSVMGSNYAVKEAVRQGMGITIASRLLVRGDAGIRAIEFQEPYTRPFSYILNKNIELDTPARLLLEYVDGKKEQIW